MLPGAFIIIYALLSKHICTLLVCVFRFIYPMMFPHTMISLNDQIRICKFRWHQHRQVGCWNCCRSLTQLGGADMVRHWRLATGDAIDTIMYRWIPCVIICWQYDSARMWCHFLCRWLEHADVFKSMLLPCHLQWWAALRSGSPIKGMRYAPFADQATPFRWFPQSLAKYCEVRLYLDYQLP